MENTTTKMCRRCETEKAMDHWQTRNRSRDGLQIYCKECMNAMTPKGTKRFHNSCQSGIYLIKNTVNGRVYVGSSKYLEARIKTHISSLTSGKHYNKALQEDWARFGSTAFDFQIVETGISDDLLKVFEQSYMDLEENLYNTTRALQWNKVIEPTIVMQYLDDLLEMLEREGN